MGPTGGTGADDAPSAGEELGCAPAAGKEERNVTAAGGAGSAVAAGTGLADKLGWTVAADGERLGASAKRIWAAGGDREVGLCGAAALPGFPASLVTEVHAPMKKQTQKSARPLL